MRRFRRMALYCALLLPCLFLAVILYRNTRSRSLYASRSVMIPDGDLNPTAVPTVAAAEMELKSGLENGLESGLEFELETGLKSELKSESETGLKTGLESGLENKLEFEFVSDGENFTPAVYDAAPVNSNNWGLSFPKEGETPIGNAKQEDLKEFDAYYIGDINQKVIYLTFDCGYENGNTDKILDALKKHNAPGAFFVVGSMIKSAPEIVKRMSDEGHIVGNHTMTHPDMSAIADIEDFENELAGVEELYREATGRELARYYRPPRGVYSPENLKQAKALGYKTILWSLAYVDWYQDNQPTEQEAYHKLLPRIHDGAIVLLHSTSKTNADILDNLLTKWEEMGYHFASLDDLPENQ